MYIIFRGQFYNVVVNLENSIGGHEVRKVTQEEGVRKAVSVIRFRYQEDWKRRSRILMLV